MFVSVALHNRTLVMVRHVYEGLADELKIVVERSAQCNACHANARWHRRMRSSLRQLGDIGKRPGKSRLLVSRVKVVDDRELCEVITRTRHRSRQSPDHFLRLR